jgi:hypothetical protein
VTDDLEAEWQKNSLFRRRARQARPSREAAARLLQTEELNSIADGLLSIVERLNNEVLSAALHELVALGLHRPDWEARLKQITSVAYSKALTGRLWRELALGASNRDVGEILAAKGGDHGNFQSAAQIARTKGLQSYPCPLVQMSTDVNWNKRSRILKQVRIDRGMRDGEISQRDAYAALTEMLRRHYRWNEPGVFLTEYQRQARALRTRLAKTSKFSEFSRFPGIVREQRRSSAKAIVPPIREHEAWPTIVRKPPTI